MAFIFVLVTVVGFGLYYFFVMAPKKEVQSLLLKDWYNYTEGYNQLWLDFDENGTMRYDFDSGYFGRTTISTEKYEIISPTKLKIGSMTYTIRFMADKTLLHFSPSIYGEEYWH